MKHIIFPLLLLFSCTMETPPPSLSSHRDTHFPPARKRELLLDAIPDMWNYLVDERGGCLVGGQYVSNGYFGGDGCVMSMDESWNRFFAYDTLTLTHFLLEQLSDTSTTSIHTCPFYSASAGEVAVYALQRIYTTNWYNFDAFKSYPSDSSGNLQACLWKILNDSSERKLLTQYWEGEVLE